MLSSHQYATKLQELADFLLSKPEFATDDTELNQNIWFWANKTGFLTAVKALGSGQKDYADKDYVKFRPDAMNNGIKFSLWINRAAVCRKVQEEKWECEPLLSQEEEAQVGA